MPPASAASAQPRPSLRRRAGGSKAGVVKQGSFRGVKRFLTRLSPPFLKPARFALSTASELFHPKLLPKFLMGYCAGWGNRRNRDGTAPPVLNIHPWGRKNGT